ncbi:sensor histidine kinase [Ruminococcus bovis]|uniref:histidine kinase n=1 Tax=Ruminococcus bovis TaxID=2564099 RepID=A0A4P8XZ57_9FIRM|nr:HAMP domain-containing sensor histidine kinase [Ruminococcus bovis]QCT06148.1 HAMP domain-containing histidine kinase [Ruminococcus bovis]
MKNKQQKRIFIVLMIIFTITLVSVLVAVNIINVNSSFRQQRRMIRDDIGFYGIEAFCGNDNQKIKRQEYDYSTSVVLKNKNIMVLSNSLKDTTDKDILNMTKELQKSGKRFGSIDNYIYLVRILKSGNTVYIFVNNKEALQNSKQFFIVSIFIFLLSVIVFTIISYYLSRWMIKPSEKAIKNQKIFVANISHDLKTPITIIRANADLIENEVKNKKSIKYIKQETEKLNHLVNEMLTLTRIDNTISKENFKNFNFGDSLFDVVLPFESIAYEKGIKFNINIDESTNYFGNETNIQKLAEILIDNAMSYTAKGGIVDVDAYESSKAVTLSVTNTGEPISDEKKEEIFDRFYRESKSRESTGNHYGLGLSIASTIVKKHNGKISVESKNGKNTFTVTLPK